MIAKTYGAAIVGIDAMIIRVETSVETGVNFMMVGLPDIAVKESHYRIATAITHCGYRLPVKKIVINMAPADLRKEGAAYDLTLAMGILAATEQLEKHGAQGRETERYLIMGELSLDGKLRPIKGALPFAVEAKKQGFEGMVLPMENAPEAAMVGGIPVYGAEHLCQVVGFFRGEQDLRLFEPDSAMGENRGAAREAPDFCDVKGQAFCKRALEITAAGGHNILLVGPPGSGKTMLARRLPGILPPLSTEEALETTKIYSVAGKLISSDRLMRDRPFRDPHHTVSYAALVGGGSYPHPGEISLAHNGVLFLDELPEFARATLEVLRQPLEDRKISICRAKMRVEYPAGFMLVASMNPCPCGYYGSADTPCTCKPQAVERYLNKVSGPLLDRMDLHVQVLPVPYKDLSAASCGEASAVIRERVLNARRIQQARFEGLNMFCNAQMQVLQINRYCVLDKASGELLKAAMQKYGLSARTYHRILKVARTIADLAGAQNIGAAHVGEALHYRCIDRADYGR